MTTPTPELTPTPIPELRVRFSSDRLSRPAVSVTKLYFDTSDRKPGSWFLVEFEDGTFVPAFGEQMVVMLPPVMSAVTPAFAAHVCRPGRRCNGREEFL